MSHTTKIVYWKSQTHWLGYLEEFPDYWTQGETLDELRTMLRSLYTDLTDGELMGIRKHEELVLA
jgi:predicted RNase H-like HicB family nuclease